MVIQLVTTTKGKTPFKHFLNNISIRNLTFAYPEQETVLENICLDIPKGSMVAIVGESGSGKSTLVDMIMGFNDPDSGTLMVDDIPLKEYDINSYRRKNIITPYSKLKGVDDTVNALAVEVRQSNVFEVKNHTIH